MSKTETVARCTKRGAEFRTPTLAFDEMDPAILHTLTPGHRVVFEEAPWLRVDDVVRLHHAKSKDRKTGTVVKVTPTRVQIEVEYIQEGGSTLTWRSLDDPDIKIVRRSIAGEVAR